MHNGSLWQFTGSPSYSVWLTHACNLRKKPMTLEDRIITGLHTFYNPVDLHGSVTELISEDSRCGIYWFPAQNAYTVMPMYWMQQLKE